jgi:hypothetical protein
MAEPASSSPKGCGPPVAERVDDLDAYRLLTAYSHDLEHRSTMCWTASAARALKAGAVILKAAASMLYRESLRR